MRTKLLTELIFLLKSKRPDIGINIPNSQETEDGETEIVEIEIGDFYIKMKLKYYYFQKKEHVDLLTIEVVHEDLDFHELTNYECALVFDGVMHSQDRGTIPMPTQEDFEKSINDWLKS